MASELKECGNVTVSEDGDGGNGGNGGGDGPLAGLSPNLRLLGGIAAGGIAGVVVNQR